MSEKSSQPLKYVFGPVPSRRLGRSLGVDLVPRKVCSLDCVYCQVGRTTRCTTEREGFVPVETVLSEVTRALEASAQPDYVTLAGSGEPTLHAGLGKIIRGVKRLTPVPVAVLTNGTLFHDPEVRRDCALADLVLPSLDAGDEKTFQHINRPAPGLTLERAVGGLVKFREEYEGEIWIEVFLIHGLNDDPEHVRRIRALADRIRPEKIQLNTAVRPTADSHVTMVPQARLNGLCKLMGPRAEVVADFRAAGDERALAPSEGDVLAMIRRRPCTVEDVAAGLGISPGEAGRHVGKLHAGTLIRKERRGDREFYVAPQDE